MKAQELGVRERARPARRPWVLTTTPFRDCSAVAVHRVWCGEDSFPLKACKAKPFCLWLGLKITQRVLDRSWISHCSNDSNNSINLWLAHNKPGVAEGTLIILTPLVLFTTLQMYYYHFTITNEETEKLWRNVTCSRSHSQQMEAFQRSHLKLLHKVFSDSNHSTEFLE